MALTDDKWSAITSQQKRAIRSAMMAKFKQKGRKMGAAKAGGGLNWRKAGGTGSLKGWEGFSKSPAAKKLEISYANQVRKTQRAKDAAGRKAPRATAMSVGAKNPALVQAQKMKSISKGGTVGRGTHAAVKGQKGGGAARIEAKAWRTKHMSAAGTDKAKRQKVQKRFKRMIGK